MGDFFEIKNSRAVEKVLNNKHKEGGGLYLAALSGAYRRYHDGIALILQITAGVCGRCRLPLVSTAVIFLIPASLKIYLVIRQLYCSR